jgi:hypothetical protein
MNFERGVTVAHDYQNGENTEEWPAQDLPGASTNAETGEAEVTANAGTAADTWANEGGTTDATDSPEFGEGAADDDSDAPVNLGDHAAAANDDTGMPGDANGDLTEELAADASDSDDDDDDADDDDDDSDDEDEDGETLELEHEGVRDIDATNVSISQGGARDIEATTVTITQGGAARVRADSLSINQGGVGFARADELTLNDGGTAFAVVTDTATFDGQSSVFLLVAGSATGDVKPVLDWRAAAAFGAAFALVLSILRRGRR